MKILYIVKQALLERDFLRWGIDFMIARGHEVIVADVSRLLHPEAPERASDTGGRPLPVIVIRTRAELARLSAAVAACDMVFPLIQSFGLNRRIYPVMRLITKARKPYLILAPFPVPGESQTQPGKSSAWRRLALLAKRIAGIDPLNSAMARLPCRWFGVKPADFIVYNSQIGSSRNSLVGPGTVPLYAHTPDYDQFLAERDQNWGSVVKDQAVFLDQYLPYHPDMRALNILGSLDSERYYGGLRRIFDRVEAELGLEVVVAAHPKAEYHLYPGVFGARKVLTGQTSRLIAESRLVMFHYSTAIGLAVLHAKPVMLLTSEDLCDYIHLLRSMFATLSWDLGIKPHALDDPETVDLSDALTIDTECYARYLHTYLRHPLSPPSPLWAIVADRLEGDA